MNYVEVAIPFFILAMLVEFVYGKLAKRQTYRLADTVISLQLGTLSRLMDVLRLCFSAVVFGTLVFLALTYSSLDTWIDIGSGFFKFGTVPVKSGGVENILTNLFSGRAFPDMDETSFAALAAFAAIAGIGGLKSTMISRYTRDQGWGMAKHSGAISGMTDMDPVTLSVTNLVEAGSVDHGSGWRAIIVAAIANLVFKGIAVAGMGDRRLLRQVLLGFAAAGLAGGAWLWFG
jgi:uncharacterized membrane protein (DUF4010 family)